MKRNILKITLLTAVVAMTTTGCRKELCYDHDQHSLGYRLQVEPEWETEWERSYGRNWEQNWELSGHHLGYHELKPDKAEGIAVILYDNIDGKLEHSDERHISADGGKVVLNKNTNAILFYNDDTEYIVFDQLGSAGVSRATTRTRTRASYDHLHEGERTVAPPDMLYGSYEKNITPVAAMGYTPMQVTMQPLVYTYVIRYNFAKGREYVALARGAFAGMAESVTLHDGSTPETSATLLFDCELTDDGVVAHVKSFGVPGFPDIYYGRTDDESEYLGNGYHVSLELRLNNGKSIIRTFDVSDQMEDQPRGGVLNINGIEISDEEGKSGGSFFDATVDDWGDQTDIDLPL